MKGRGRPGRARPPAPAPAAPAAPSSRGTPSGRRACRDRKGGAGVGVCNQEGGLAAGGAAGGRGAAGQGTGAACRSGGAAKPRPPDAGPAAALLPAAVEEQQLARRDARVVRPEPGLHGRQQRQLLGDCGAEEEAVCSSRVERPWRKHRAQPADCWRGAAKSTLAGPPRARPPHPLPGSAPAAPRSAPRRRPRRKSTAGRAAGAAGAGVSAPAGTPSHQGSEGPRPAAPSPAARAPRGAPPRARTSCSALACCDRNCTYSGRLMAPAPSRSNCRNVDAWKNAPACGPSVARHSVATWGGGGGGGRKWDGCRGHPALCTPSAQARAAACWLAFVGASARAPCRAPTSRTRRPPAQSRRS
jgi:hypothetical protein